MHYKKSLGLFALASSLLIAACGSNTATSPAAGSAATTAAADTESMPKMEHSTTTTGNTMQMGPHDTMAMDHGAPAAGLRLDVATTTFESTKSSDLSFAVVTRDGSTVNSYQVEQTKELHLVLVRSDLTGYQHVHPTRGADGTWTIPVTFSKGGSYRMVADFVPVIDGTATGRTSITADLMVSGAGSDTPLPPPSSTAKVDGYSVQLDGDLTSASESQLTYTIVDGGGQAVMLEPYLGAYGHLVAFSKADLAYTHIHPDSAEQANGVVHFVGQVASAGPHRLFLQFAAAGAVHTAEFTVNAT